MRSNFDTVRAALLVLLGALGYSSAPADTIVVAGASGEPGMALTVPLRFENSSDVVGMQFDVVFVPSQVYVGPPVSVGPAASRRASSRPFEESRRIVVDSPSGAAILEGAFVELPVTLTEGVPEGGTTLRITNVIFTDRDGEEIAPSVRYHPIDEWRLGNFSSEELADPEIIGDHVDIEGDGLSNLQEFLSSRNPKVADGGSDFVGDVRRDEATGSLVLTSRFSVAKNATDVVDLRIETSADLGTWVQAEMAVVEPTGLEDETTTEFEARVLIDGSDRSFLRIGVARRESIEP